MKKTIKFKTTTRSTNLAFLFQKSTFCAVPISLSIFLNFFQRKDLINHPKLITFIDQFLFVIIILSTYIPLR
ncbi:MAG: Unknown protein [uncultured Aureispira sp.]|uniref:Uncharacterized protein n=1 Tax=uncultured Aureispira sp. TaxID=1331704 RepID=A0A6S6SNK3_9BACT|nr:MAG: Unknown protein [uncultured Aureispira sp.]